MFHKMECVLKQCPPYTNTKLRILSGLTDFKGPKNNAFLHSGRLQWEVYWFGCWQLYLLSQPLRNVYIYLTYLHFQAMMWFQLCVCVYLLTGFCLPWQSQTKVSKEHSHNIHTLTPIYIYIEDRMLTHKGNVKLT